MQTLKKYLSLVFQDTMWKWVKSDNNHAVVMLKKGHQFNSRDKTTGFHMVKSKIGNFWYFIP